MAGMAQVSFHVIGNWKRHVWGTACVKSAPSSWRVFCKLDGGLFVCLVFVLLCLLIPRCNCVISFRVWLHTYSPWARSCAFGCDMLADPPGHRTARRVLQAIPGGLLPYFVRGRGRHTRQHRPHGSCYACRLKGSRTLKHRSMWRRYERYFILGHGSSQQRTPTLNNASSAELARSLLWADTDRLLHTGEVLSTLKVYSLYDGTFRSA